jgi:hypothetical protein
VRLQRQAAGLQDPRGALVVLRLRGGPRRGHVLRGVDPGVLVPTAGRGERRPRCSR